MTKRDELREWAEDHGYTHGRCPVHGGFWTDSGFACPDCAEDDEEDSDDDPPDEEIPEPDELPAGEAAPGPPPPDDLARQE